RAHSGSPSVPYTTLFRSRVRAGADLTATREAAVVAVARVAAHDHDVERGTGVGVLRGHHLGPVRAERRHARRLDVVGQPGHGGRDRKSTRLNSSHVKTSY